MKLFNLGFRKRNGLKLITGLALLIVSFQNCSPSSPTNNEESSQTQQSKLDTDQDGVVDTDDCEPENSNSWRIYSYVAIDGDGDGVPVLSSGEQCVGSEDPAGKLAEYSASAEDCNDLDASTQNNQTYYQDADSDGYGKAQGMQFCSSTPPTGYSVASGDPDDTKVAVTPLNTDGDQQPDSTDCAPTDASKFRMVRLRTDNDGDGQGTLVSEQSQCIGSVVPAGLTMSLAYDDCDDNNSSVFYYRSLYRDEDGDGEGLSGTTPGRLCAGTSIPMGYAATNRDCNDQDATVKLAINAYPDADNDSYGVTDQRQLICASTLPSGLVKDGGDRDDNNAAVNIPTVSISNYEGAGGGVVINTKSPINLILTTYRSGTWNFSGSTLNLRKVTIRGYEDQRVNGFSKHEKFDGKIAQYCQRCSGSTTYYSYEYGGFTKVENLSYSPPSTTYPISTPPATVTIDLGPTDLSKSYSSYKSAKYVISDAP